MDWGFVGLLYACGVCVAFGIVLIRDVFFFIYRRTTGLNTLFKNISTIDPEVQKSLRSRLLSILPDVALSWLSVAIFLFWMLPVAAMLFFRRLFESNPDIVKRLQYPLRLNPKMAAEHVWANCYALNVLRGEQMIGDRLVSDSLSTYVDKLECFDVELAIEYLAEANAFAFDAEKVKGFLDQADKDLSFSLD